MHVFFTAYPWIQGKRITIGICFFVMMQVILYAAQESPPSVFIDKDTCPGEGCFYKGKVRVTKSTSAYTKPDENLLAIYEITAGDIVTSFKSEVHTVAGRFMVKRSYERYRPGDVLWVYTYLGGGMFKVWHGGRMHEKKLGFSPWGGSAGKRCEKDNVSCWGELEEELDMQWWLKVKSIDGHEGWIRVNENLEWEGV